MLPGVVLPSDLLDDQKDDAKSHCQAKKTGSEDDKVANGHRIPTATKLNQINSLLYYVD